MQATETVPRLHIPALTRAQVRAQCRIADLESCNGDLSATIKSKAEDVQGKEQVLADLEHEVQEMHGVISAVDKQLQTYQVCAASTLRALL